MAVQTFRFFAPLSNATGHYSSLRLARPFRIEAWPRDKIVRTWRIQEGVPKFHIEINVDDQCIQFEKGNAYVIAARVRLDDQDIGKAHRELSALVDRLRCQMRALSLFLNTDIGPHYHYWYADFPMGSERSFGPAKFGRKHLWPRDVQITNRFIRRTKFPLKHEYLELALEHWEQSLSSPNENLELLSLMMALEALFNTGQTDLRYRVSRSVAVLLGKWMHSSEAAFDYIGKAYDLRSKLVHTGKAELKGFHVSALRGWVKSAIVKLIEIDLPKQSVADILTRLPFGQGSNISHQSKRILLDLNRHRRWESHWKKILSK